MMVIFMTALVVEGDNDGLFNWGSWTILTQILTILTQILTILTILTQILTILTQILPILALTALGMDWI